MQKEVETRDFVRVVNFEFIDSLEINKTMYLSIFDDLSEEISSSTGFFDTAIAGWGTIYIKHNLFDQSTFGQNVELQKTHIVHFI